MLVYYQEEENNMMTLKVEKYEKVPWKIYEKYTNYKDNGAGAKRKKKSFLLCIGERNHFHTGPINIGILWFSQSPNGFRLVLQEMVLSARPVVTALVLVLHIVLCFWIWFH